MWHWRREISADGYRHGVALGLAFIFLCGGHHAVMVAFDMAHRGHPMHTAQVALDAAMAVVSILAAQFLRLHRREIRTALARIAG